LEPKIQFQNKGEIKFDLKPKSSLKFGFKLGFRGNDWC